MAATVSYSSTLSTTTQKTVEFYGTATVQASPATYATGGLLAASGAAFLNLGPYADRTPLLVTVQSQSGSGYTYTYVPTSKKLMIQTGGTATGTVASTSTAPTITTGTNATVTAVVATNGGALTQATGATGITGVQAPTITSTFTGSATPGGEIGTGSIPAGVSGDTIVFHAVFPRS
jgi:hypothetical protein